MIIQAPLSLCAYVWMLVYPSQTVENNLFFFFGKRLCKYMKQVGSILRMEYFAKHLSILFHGREVGSFPQILLYKEHELSGYHTDASQVL